MVQVLRLLRRLPVAQKVEDIAIFINRELLPFLQELRESTAATFEQITTNTLLGRDSAGTGDVEFITLDDTLEFTGSQVIQRAEITGDVEIPAGSNVATVPALTGILSDIVALESDVSDIESDIVVIEGDIVAIEADVLDLQNAEFITYASNAALTAERVATTSATVQVDLGTAGQAKWNVLAPSVHLDTVSGSLGDYQLPASFRSGDTVRFTLTADTTVNGFVLSTGAAPAEGTEMNLCLSDQSGGAAPGWTFTIPDAGGGVAQFRTPGQVQGTSPGPSYVMQSEEEGCRCAYQTGAWRIISGTAAQAITGDITVSAGNGSTRTAEITAGVIVNADVNASAAIAQTKLGATTGFSVKASGSAATTSAEPIVTYSSSANMSAERVTTSSTSITVSTAVASQIEFQRAALTGAITAAANTNATLFDASASGAGLTGGGTAILAVGAGTGITVNANDVAVTNPMPAVGPIGSQLVSFGSFSSAIWCHVFTENFFGPIGDARFLGNHWVWNTAGSMNVTDITSIASHPGIRRFTRTVASGVGTAMAYVGDSSTDPAINISDVAFLYFVVRAPTVAVDQTALTDKRLIIGLVADASDPTNLGGNGLVLILDLDGVTTWRIKDENASSATFTATVTATLDVWVECLLVNEGSGNWGIQVNGTDYGTHSGVITSGMLLPAIICNETSAVGAILDVDEFTIGFLSAANRYG
jgi:hypothetical protein